MRLCPTNSFRLYSRQKSVSAPPKSKFAIISITWYTGFQWALPGFSGHHYGKNRALHLVEPAPPRGYNSISSNSDSPPMTPSYHSHRRFFSFKCTSTTVEPRSWNVSLEQIRAKAASQVYFEPPSLLLLLACLWGNLLRSSAKFCKFGRKRLFVTSMRLAVRLCFGDVVRANVLSQCNHHQNLHKICCEKIRIYAGHWMLDFAAFFLFHSTSKPFEWAWLVQFFMALPTDRLFSIWGGFYEYWKIMMS